MRPNPLLMTVLGNPCHSGTKYQANPFVLIDSKTNKIIRTWRGSMMDRKPWDWASDAARRLGRPVFIVAHPHVPKTFRAGVEVSPLFYAGGPFQEVHPDGSTRRADHYGYKRNPSFMASAIGGLTGGLVAKALSNPRGPSHPDEHAAHELELYVSNDSQLYHSQFVPIVKNLMKRRAAGTYNHEKAAKLFLYLADAGAKKYYKEFGTQSGGFKFDLATRWLVAKMFRDSFETEAELGNYDKMAFGVSNNPPRTRKGAENAIDKEIGSAWARLMSGVQVPIMDIPRIFRDIKLEMAAGADLESAVRSVGTQYRVNKNPRRSKARKVQANPVGRRRKVTMSLEKFARYIKSKNDPKLWDDLIKKIKGYQKWTHGSLPKTVTVEIIDKPGVNGIWITYEAGTVPESAYIMPKGSKRKGAWKHPWDTPLKIKHDPETGIIMHKLGGKSKMTDFYHK